jgi:hypothetical protein
MPRCLHAAELPAPHKYWISALHGPLGSPHNVGRGLYCRVAGAQRLVRAVSGEAIDYHHGAFHGPDGLPAALRPPRRLHLYSYVVPCVQIGLGLTIPLLNCLRVNNC